MTLTTRNKRILIGAVALPVLIVLYLLLLRPFVGGFFYARSAPLFDSLLCVESPNFDSMDLGGSEFYASWSCEKAVYAFRGTKEDVALMNSDIKYLDAIVGIEDKAKAEKMLNFWLSRGANINVQAGTGSTLLFSTSMAQDAGKVAWLIAHGARTDIRDKQGRTALEFVRAYQERTKLTGFEPVMKVLGG